MKQFITQNNNEISIPREVNLTSRGYRSKEIFYFPAYINEYTLQVDKNDNGNIFQYLWQYFGGDIDEIDF